MNGKKLLTVLLVALAGFGILATSTLAARGLGPKPGGGQPVLTEEQRDERLELHLARMTAMLDLTEEQQTQIRELQKSRWEKNTELRERMGQLREELRQAGLDGTFDEARVRSLATELADIKTELMVENVRTRSQVHALLTPEQQLLAEKLRPGMRGCRGPGHCNNGSLSE